MKLGVSKSISLALGVPWHTLTLFTLCAFLLLPALASANFWPEEIEKRIIQSRLMGKTPVIWVDLDGTLFSTSVRIHNILKNYDLSKGTKIFENFPIQDLTRLDTSSEVTRKFLYSKFSQTEAEKLHTEIDQYLYDNRFVQNVASKDEVYMPLLKQLKQWELAGAEIRFLSGRDERLRIPTESVIGKYNLSHIPLHIKKPEIPSAPFKRETMEVHQSLNPNSESIALFEDDAKNRIEVYKKFPETVILNITQLANELVLDAPEVKPLFESAPTVPFDTSSRYAKQIDKWNFRFQLGRVKTHAQILNTFTERPTRQSKPWILFTAGTFASGKSTVVKRMESEGYFNAGETVWIDPDRIRSQIPEFAAFKILDKENAGALVQLETGYMQELLLEAALRQRENIIVEGTLRSPDWWEAEFKRMRKMYPEYRIGILSVSTDVSTAYARMKEREKKKGQQDEERIIPDETFKRVSAEIPDSLRILGPMVDFRIDIDNNTEAQITRIQNGTEFEGNFKDALITNHNSVWFRVISDLLKADAPGITPQPIQCADSFRATIDTNP